MVLEAGAIASEQREFEATQDVGSQTCFAKVLRCITLGLWMLLMFRRGIGGGFDGCLDVFL